MSKKLSLQDKITQKMLQIYQEQQKINNKNLTQMELLELLIKSDSTYSRLPQNTINKYIKEFYSTIKDSNNKDQIQPIQSTKILNEEEPEIKKKVKINSNAGMQPLDPEIISQFPKLEDLGGITHIRPLIDSLIYMPLQHSHLFDELGISAPKGILLTGTTGCGKTYLAKAICHDLYLNHQLSIYIKHGAEFMASLSGESEKNIRQLFESATANAPSLVFLDEIDVIAGSRDKATKEMERRVVSQILGCLDMLPNNVFLIAATSHPDYLDAGLRRSGRFDKEILISVPDDNQREDILIKILSKLKFNPEININQLARRTPGYVASDLLALCREGGVNAVKRISKIVQEIVQIEMSDFEGALKTVQPTAKREGFAVIPDVTWNDIGSLHELRETLENCIVLPIQNPEIFEQFSVRPPAGVLLWGPPGCGKTLLAKVIVEGNIIFIQAVANASRANFIAVKGPELLNKYVGESEKAIRNLFTRARSSQPCIIFFDEIDAICPIRGADGSGQVTERVVNQLLTELDGFEERKQVFIIAATNRPDILDPALLRPGRIDKPLFVPLPDIVGRSEILKALSRKSPLGADINFESLSGMTENLTGADLAHLLTSAALNAIIKKQNIINHQNMIEALETLKPSLQEHDRKAYEKMRQKWSVK